MGHTSAPANLGPRVSRSNSNVDPASFARVFTAAVRRVVTAFASGRERGISGYSFNVHISTTVAALGLERCSQVGGLGVRSCDVSLSLFSFVNVFLSI